MITIREKRARTLGKGLRLSGLKQKKKTKNGKKLSMYKE